MTVVGVYKGEGTWVVMTKVEGNRWGRQGRGQQWQRAIRWGEGAMAPLGLLKCFKILTQHDECSKCCGTVSKGQIWVT